MDLILVAKSVLATKQGSDVANKSDKKMGKVIQRNYVMNDVGALRKKMSHEKRKHDFVLAKEAKDGSNVIIQMRASFFEFTKAKFIDEIQHNDDVSDVQNGEAVKAATEGSGDAYVEYSMDISFMAKDKAHTIKMIAYTTTCQLMIQPKGEQSGLKSHLGSRGTPRYFADTFFLPWCEKAVETKAFDENISGVYMAALREEIKRMEMNKQELRKGTKNASLNNDISDAKCASKGCSFQGINPNNKSAVGVCSKCGNFEHFACVKIKQEHKEDILKGIMKYYCSDCFSKNPSIGSMNSVVSNKTRPRLDSIPIMGQGYLFKVTASTTVTAIASEESEAPPDDRQLILLCEHCNFETKEHQELEKHLESKHRVNCDHCYHELHTNDLMEEHIKVKHTVSCSLCDTKVLRSSTDLDNHMKACHSFPCIICTKIFKSSRELNDHMNTHIEHCPQCDHTSSNRTELDVHIEQTHKFACGMCNETFVNNSTLQEHHAAHHVFKCDHCEACYTSKEGLKTHTSENHSFCCIECNVNTNSKAEMDNHQKSNHQVTNPEENSKVNRQVNPEESSTVDQEKSAEVNTPSSIPDNTHYECIICEIRFADRKDLRKHMEDEHTYDCDICNIKHNTRSLLRSHNQSMHNFKCSHCEETKCSQEDLNGHIESKHTFICPVCKIKLISKPDLEKHQNDDHTLCTICSVDFKTKEEVENHMKENHTLCCDLCSFSCLNEGSMEDHILDKHAKPEADNWYKCDDCSFKTKEKAIFGEHYKHKHGSEAPTKKLEEENRILKNNFERLEGMYHDSLEEVNQVKSEYESKVIIANDNFTVIQAENEVLKEKIDILFKLGRSYLNRNTSTNKNEERNEENEEDEIEVIEEEADNIESLQEWTKNKMRGYKRGNPASKATSQGPSKELPKSKPSATPNIPPKKGGGASKSKPTQPINSGNRSQNPTEDNSPNPTNHPTPPESQVEAGEDRFRGKYCHYFVNQGRCNFEERSGFKCRFEHKAAPMCNFGANCSRTKCMFSHPKLTGGNNTFLGNTRGFTPIPNPWQMINPWMNQPNQFQTNQFQPNQFQPNQFLPNPWNGQESRNKQ